jgi:hypothetical protein
VLDRHFPIHKLKPMAMPSGGRKEQEQRYEVDAIRDSRVDKQGKRYEYKVHWKGYPEKENSWVHEKDFDGLALIRKYWKEKNDAKKKTKVGKKPSRKRSS